MVKCWQCAVSVTGLPACWKKTARRSPRSCQKRAVSSGLNPTVLAKDLKKADIVKKFIQYMLSPVGQVKSAQMAAYPGFAITKSGRAKLIEIDRKEAERTGQINGMSNDPISLIKDGRIHYRNIPVQQSLEDWNDFWSEYKNA